MRVKAKYYLKKSFLKIIRLFIDSRRTVLNNFKCKIFLLKNLNKTLTLEPAPEPAPKLELEPEAGLAPDVF